MLFINSENQIYSGDKQDNDRALTSEECESWLVSQNKEIEINELTRQIKDLDVKRIRAIAEPSLRDGASGQTWLEYYTEQIQELRVQISAL